MWEDKLRFEVEMGNEQTEVEREEGSGEVADRWVLGGPPLLWPTSLVHARNPVKFAPRRSTSRLSGEQCNVLLTRALVSRPPLVLLDEVWSGMDEGLISAVWRCLTEGSGVRGTGSIRDYALG